MGWVYFWIFEVYYYVFMFYLGCVNFVVEDIWVDFVVFFELNVEDDWIIILNIWDGGRLFYFDLLCCNF